MIIEAEVSLYPLRTESLSPPIDDFIAHLKESGLQVQPGPMSSWVTGELTEVFSALTDAFSAVAARWHNVLVIKVSNACPSADHQIWNSRTAIVD